MLNGKIVLITGAKGGLGSFVTDAFLNAGAVVVGTSRSIARSDFAHPNFHAEPAELDDGAKARALISRVVSQLQRVDALVHLVGGFAGGKTVDDTDDATLDHMLDMNLRSFFHIARAVLPVMRIQTSGSVLAIGSRTAMEPAETLGAYTASKAALVALVRTIALENKQTGISANVILPGTMDTPANRLAMPTANFSQWVNPGQVASLLVHLASDAAKQVTGAVIPIYGGEL